MISIAVAVSGGADSIALLRLAAARFGGAAVIALAVDHRTRRRATSVERTLVETAAARLGASFRRLVIADGVSGQAGWRAARLAALARFCRTARIERLWLGHHADDGLETAAIRLLAGGPLTGAAGMSAARPHGNGLRIERPLLGMQGRALRRELMRMGQSWAEDPSNRDPRYKRVAVRRAMAGGGSPAAAALVRRIGHWRARRELAVADAWRRVAYMHPYGAVAFEGRGLSLLPEVLRLELLRRGALATTGAPGRWREPELGALARDGTPRPLGGAAVWCDGSTLWLCRHASAIQERRRLVPGRALTWDRRYTLCFEGQLPAGDWSVRALGHDAARRLAVGRPVEAVAALPALYDGARLAAVPELGIWRGRNGPALAAGLRCERVALDAISLFHLATGMR